MTMMPKRCPCLLVGEASLRVVDALVGEAAGGGGEVAWLADEAARMIIAASPTRLQK